MSMKLDSRQNHPVIINRDTGNILPSRVSNHWGEKVLTRAAFLKRQVGKAHQ
jgi:hypothetical protein